MAKDMMAAKPMVLYESDDFIALASEEVAIRSMFPHEIDTFDPYEGEVRVWKRKREPDARTNQASSGDKRPMAQRSMQMGMHTEQLSGRTQQRFFSPSEEENFLYPGAL